jgi:hypothetical protein
MSQHQIFFVGGSEDESCSFVTEQDGENCVVTCTYRDKTIEAFANDFFDALCGIRLQLESERLIPFCYGASLNVYPSGMARQMSSGKSAYKLEIGRHATKDSLVQIFAEGADVIPAFVARQKEYFDEWLQSSRV